MVLRRFVTLLVVLETLFVRSSQATGHGLLPQETFSSAFDIFHEDESLLTRKIRQSNELSQAIIEGTSRNSVENNNNNVQLICHQCRSFDNGTNSGECIHLSANSSAFSRPCGPQHTACMVKRFSFTENSTSPISLWYIERNCSSKCEPGCLILGERTKVYACTSCCNQDRCNIGNGANIRRLPLDLVAIIVLFFIPFLSNICKVV